MKLLILLIGIAIGACAVWYFRPAGSNHPSTPAGQKIEENVRSAGDSIQQKLDQWHLRGDDIKDELAKTGRVIRENAHKAGNAISDATADARITGAIKTELIRDPDLSAWNISVSTTDGVVTLSGSVSNPDQVGKAMALAMQTDGVKQVVSTLQVKPENKP
jgi:gas vesicle protein